MLADSAHIQQSDAEFCNKRRSHRKSKGLDDRECAPLYTLDDAAHTYPLFHAGRIGRTARKSPARSPIAPTTPATC